jgi:hypothetical protein
MMWRVQRAVDKEKGSRTNRGPSSAAVAIEHVESLAGAPALRIGRFISKDRDPNQTRKR